MIRLAFESAGIHSQLARKQIVESVAIRGVSSLRELYAHETRRVLCRIVEHSKVKPRRQGQSEWDLREETTWIDRL